jgi:aryl-alcohol dehydrogenase-like predicted oxidoreductase
MQFTNLGKTGLKVSRICLGCMSYGDPRAALPPEPPRWQWALDEEQGRLFIRRAVELGINFFDTANIYSLGASEEILGRAIRDFAKRDEVVVATKVHGAMRLEPNGHGLSRKAILGEIDASLRRLGTDYVDLYQIHRWDYETPIEETLEALHDVVKAGKARYIGASSMFAWQFSRALHLADARCSTRFVSMQNHYNLLNREEEREMIPLCRAEGVGIIPWSPLARGRLARGAREEAKTDRARTDRFGKALYGAFEESDAKVIDRVEEVAKKRGVPSAQVSLAWLLHKPGVTAPIVGATKMHHLDDAVAAVSLRLSDDETRFLEEPYVPHPVVGFN